jgi:SAM-dependent methyltransferase
MSEPSLHSVQEYWNRNPAGFEEVKHLHADRIAFFDERDYQTQTLYPKLDTEYNFARARDKLTLELGCGMGYNAQRLAQYGARLIAMDLAPNAVRLTQERFKLRHLSAQFLIADAEHLPFKTNSFELIFSSGVIHHSPNTQAAADEITRTLQTGGAAAVMVYHRDSIWFWWDSALKLGLLMWLLNSLPNFFVSQILKRFPHWQNLILPKGERLQFNDVIRSGTDFGGLQNPLSRVYTKHTARQLFHQLSSFRFITEFHTHRPFDQNPSAFTKLIRLVVDWLNERWGWFLIIHARKS